MSNGTRKVQPKQVVKFRRAEASLLGSPIVGAFAVLSYLPEQNLLLSLTVGLMAATIGNFLNYIDDRIDYLTVGGFASAIPFLGALVPKEFRISEDAPYTFVKNQVESKDVSKPKTITGNFLDENMGTRDAWDDLFRTETGFNAYSYLKNSVKTDLIGEGLHAWYIQSMETVLATHGIVGVEDNFNESFADKAEKVVYRRKLARAKAKGEYVPIHWEHIAE